MVDNITNTLEQKSKHFYSLPLSNVKFDGLKKYCTNVRDSKRTISEYIIENREDFLKNDTLYIINREPFITKIRHTFPDLISSLAYGETCKTIHTNYDTKFKNILKKLTIKEKVVRDILYYKNKTTVKRKDENGNEITVVKMPGDVREIRYKYIETSKTKTLTFLAKFGRENTYDWLKNAIKDDSIPNSKKKNYKLYLEVIEEYGFEVLLSEALEHRNKVLDEYLNEVEYTSININVSARASAPFVKNDKRRSVVGLYLTLAIPYTDVNGIEHKHMIIPLLYNKEYHGDISLYNPINPEKSRHTILNIVLDEYTKTIIVSKAIEEEVSHREPTQNDVLVGADVNTVGDAIVGSNGTRIKHSDNDKKVISKIAKLIKKQKRNLKLEKAKAKEENRNIDTSHILTLKEKRKLNKLKKVHKEHQSDECLEFVNSTISTGGNHIVMENLDGKFGKTRAVDSENQQNFNDLTSAECISDYKNIMERLCQKKHLSFSTVQPEYTSQRCPECGCVHKSNRKNQSEFECMECGHRANADANASVNIKDRVGNEKLCVALLKTTLDGYEPKDNITMDEVLEKLLKYRGSGDALKNKKENGTNDDMIDDS